VGPGGFSRVLVCPSALRCGVVVFVWLWLYLVVFLYVLLRSGGLLWGLVHSACYLHFGGFWCVPIGFGRVRFVVVSFGRS